MSAIEELKKSEVLKVKKWKAKGSRAFFLMPAQFLLFFDVKDINSLSLCSVDTTQNGKKDGTCRRCNLTVYNKEKYYIVK